MNLIAAGEGTLQALEFAAVRNEIAAFADCAVGRSEILALLPRLGERAWADAELSLVDDITGFFLASGEISLAAAVDALPLVERAVKGARLAPIELRELSDTESKLRSAVQAASSDRRPHGSLHALAGTHRSTDEVIESIERAIEPEGSVSDAASGRLGAIRKQHRELAGRARERCRALLAHARLAKLLSEPVVTLRSGRYVLPVRSDAAAHFPGVVLDQSASGATVFMEPLASVEDNNRLRTLQAEEEREIARVLAALSQRVAQHETQLRSNAWLLRRLDGACARARWAIDKGAIRPNLCDEPSLRIVQGRHPLLRRKAVPLDFELGFAFDAVVVSGPNMGGKTVLLKTVGLLVLLAYAGIPVPASATSVIGNFHPVACTIGDEQSIAEDLSSFSAHLRALGAVTEISGPSALILIDEIGSGTEPSAGTALAQAFIETWIARGSKAVVTTHFTPLKVFAASHDRVRNASLLFDSVTHAPSYVFALGVPGQSLAFELAHALELPEPIVDRARELVGADVMNLEQTFEQLAAERERLRRAQAQLEELKAREERLEQTLQRRLAELDREKESFDRRAAQELARAAVRVRETLMEQARRRSETAARQAAKPAAEAGRALERALSEMRQALGLQAPEPGEPGELATQHYAPGDAVHVASLHADGVVRDVYERGVLVAVGNLHTVVARSDLSKRGAGLAAGGHQRAALTTSNRPAPEQRVPAMDAVRSVDVRGLRVDEAWPMVDKALDDAMLAGLAEVRIVHGKGTGQLARGIHEFLQGHPQVAHAAFAPEREGGTGVTNVKLR